MYILRTKGTAEIPDYIQIRDNNFVLTSHFKMNKAKQVLNKLIGNNNIIPEDLPYGVLQKIEQ